MAFVLKLTLFISVLVAIGWGFFSHIPVPPSVGEPWKYSLAVGIHKVIVMLAPQFGDFEFIQTSHAKIQYALSSRGDSQIQITTEMFQDVPVRLYLPRESGVSRPGVVFFHGGGFNLFTTYGYDGLCMRMARDLDAVVASIEYRLAPQYVIPTAFEDSKRATLFFFENSGQWEVDPDSIGAVGDGNGAGLALAMGLLLRDAGSFRQFTFLGLLSPAVQGLDYSLPSFSQLDQFPHDLSHRDAAAFAMSQYFNHSQYINETKINAHVSSEIYNEYKNHINRTMLDAFLQNNYCVVDNYPEIPISDKFEFDLTDPYNMPLMADSFEDLPPTFVMTAESDGFRDEGVIVAGRMAKDGQVMHVHSTQGWHGMMMFLDAPLYVQEASDMADKLIEFTSAYTI